MTDFEAVLRAIPAGIADMERLRRRVDGRDRCIRLTREEVTSAPHLIWNAFVVLLQELPHERMTEVQQSASLAFWYDSEVQNGGHFQFFVNSAEGPWKDVASALARLKLEPQADLFREAEARWQGLKRELSTDTEGFVAAASDGEFDDIDAAYHSLMPTIQEALELLLKLSRDQFVRID